MTSQDGAYLAQLLLGKGYDVWGLYRRTTNTNFWRLRWLGLENRIHLVQGDISDASCLMAILKESQPDEIYNMAAQSFVEASFHQPLTTATITGLGTLGLLELVRVHCPKTRVYQASSSEMFGENTGHRLRETDAMLPASPYAAAKLFAHNVVRIYREAYGMFATSGVLFNHESITYQTPVIVRQDGVLDILPVGEIVGSSKVDDQVAKRTDNLYVWDKDGFTKVRAVTGYKASPVIVELEARGGAVEITRDHKICTVNGGVIAQQLGQGTSLETIELPKPPCVTDISENMAWMLGAFVADGSATKHYAVFSNNNPSIRQHFAEVWRSCTGGYVSEDVGRSGFTGEPVYKLRLYGAPWFAKFLNDECYTKNRKKRIPRLVLNATQTAWECFVEGYNEADGLKAGHGHYKYKNFKTNSSVLATGLWMMVMATTGQRVVLNIDRKPSERGKYYSLNINSPESSKGQHLVRPLNEVKRNRRNRTRDWWFYNLETESGMFHAGVGQLRIHNSPLRGLEFVTRKVTNAVAMIATKQMDKLPLGNLKAKRDWGHAREYVEAMWMMLQQREPGDYVVATGEWHSVEELCAAAFGRLEVDWHDYVYVDPALLRPLDVPGLIGDYSKVETELGWRPRTKFKELIEEMVDVDLDRWRRALKGEVIPWDVR